MGQLGNNLTLRVVAALSQENDCYVREQQEQVMPKGGLSISSSVVGAIVLPAAIVVPPGSSCGVITKPQQGASLLTRCQASLIHAVHIAYAWEGSRTVVRTPSAGVGAELTLPSDPRRKHAKPEAA